MVNLLRKTSCHHIVAHLSSVRSLIDATKSEIVSHRPDHKLLVVEIPSMSMVYPKLGAECDDTPFNPYPGYLKRPRVSDAAIYIHSSGSTGFPKPIMETHKMLIQWAAQRKYLARIYG